jgi:hypothetical protein
LVESSLGKEALLEQMIVADPSILSDAWLLIGQQVRTDHGGCIDLLALDPDARLIVIELKRDRTPREVVAQAIDYASWVRDLASDRLAEIYQKFAPNGSLNHAFQKRFGISLDEERLDGSHEIVVVASTLDASTERIVRYLRDRDIEINVIFFQVFQDGANQYLSRSWLLDPVEIVQKPAGPEKGDWNGEHYVSFGESQDRSWEEARQFGFISGGGGSWYSQTLSLLEPGDRVWVNVPRQGYVGVGEVTGGAVRARDFKVTVDGVQRPALDVLKARYHRHLAEDEAGSEYFVPIKWHATRPLAQAVSEVGFFGNQNTVCRPRTSKWNHTVERLKQLLSPIRAEHSGRP